MTYDDWVTRGPDYDNDASEFLDKEWDADLEPYDPGPDCLTPDELAESLDIYERELDRNY